ncbi:MAG: 50S ribosomal protein L25/general stress protein Ctc [Rikenellaceae bacterium]
MKTIEFKAQERASNGKKGAKAVRKSGSVPCVVYGNGETIHCSIEDASVRELIYTPSSYIVNLDFGGKTESVVMREVQYHPVKDNVLHIDFYRIDEKKPIAIDVPIKLNGVAEGVKSGGKLMLSKRKVTISALISDLPDQLDIDITNLELGKSIFVSDLSFENIEILTPATTAICAVRMTRAARGAAAAAAAAKK